MSWTSVHSFSGTLSDLIPWIYFSLWFRSYLNGLVVFPTFFKYDFGNKEFMIWATVSSWSCFCWLCWASPSLAAKNIINLISVLTIWWCPCVESSLVLLEGGVCYDQCILLAKLYQPLPWFILYSKAKFACSSRRSLTSYFCIPVFNNEKDIFVWVLVLEGLIGLHRSVHHQLLQHYWSGYRLVTPWCWMVCLGMVCSSSMGFSRQEYWSGFPSPSPGDLPNPGFEYGSPTL